MTPIPRDPVTADEFLAVFGGVKPQAYSGLVPGAGRPLEGDAPGFHVLRRRHGSSRWADEGELSAFLPSAT